ncbi:MAG: hypothetical protein ACM3S0_13920 [Acidobacteriota bacterium]
MIDVIPVMTGFPPAADELPAAVGAVVCARTPPARLRQSLRRFQARLIPGASSWHWIAFS